MDFLKQIESRVENYEELLEKVEEICKQEE